MFVGARSDEDQDKWFWNNGTVVKDTNFTTPNDTVCQEMTWPLTYDDGINLLSKPCESGMSHYICEINCMV